MPQLAALPHASLTITAEFPIPEDNWCDDENCGPNDDSIH
jgi:hypothetical protein